VFILDDWKKIKIDAILNYTDANTGQMNRYDRIMRQYEIEALSNVRAGLFDLKKSVHHVGSSLAERIESFENATTKATQRQGKLQVVTVWLTIVIALSAVGYTWVTWESVQVQRESNRIQLLQQEPHDD
jgi:hypothetical protein